MYQGTRIVLVVLAQTLGEEDPHPPGNEGGLEW